MPFSGSLVVVDQRDVDDESVERVMQPQFRTVLPFGSCGIMPLCQIPAR